MTHIGQKSFQLDPFVPRHSNMKKVTLFVQYNDIGPFVFNNMVCFNIKIAQYFDPAIANYTYRFVIIPLNLTK